MHFTFDAAKDVSNTAKHGVSLALAEQVEWGTALVWPDTRRVISLRKANPREIDHYAKA